MKLSDLQSLQRSYDSQEDPTYWEDYDDSECHICVYYRFGQCRAMGETNETGDCPSFRD